MKMQKKFKKRDPKIKSEPFFIAKINDETKTGLAIAAQLLEIHCFLKKFVITFLANENLNKSK